MKKCITKYLSIALLALAGLALSTSAAKAYTFSDGDLFLGFYESGKSSDYILYIGNYAQYTNGTSFSLNSTIGSASQINTDLTAVFGANWTTAVKWSVIGLQDSTGASTLFATDPGATSSLATLGADSSTNQGGTGTNIVTMAGAFGINGANGATAPRAPSNPSAPPTPGKASAQSGAITPAQVSANSPAPIPRVQAVPT